jgi:hypothetical protein
LKSICIQANWLTRCGQDNKIIRIMTFDKLCVFSGITYCKKGYSRCVPNTCRFRHHIKKDMIEHPKIKKIVQLPDMKFHIKTKRRR